MAKHGAASFQLTMLVNETFEEIVSSLSSMGNEAYTALCEKVLPSLTGAFDVGNMTEDNPLTTLATELMAVLTENVSPSLKPIQMSSLLLICLSNCCVKYFLTCIHDG